MDTGRPDITFGIDQSFELVDDFAGLRVDSYGGDFHYAVKLAEASGLGINDDGFEVHSCLSSSGTIWMFASSARKPGACGSKTDSSRVSDQNCRSPNDAVIDDGSSGAGIRPDLPVNSTLAAKYNGDRIATWPKSCAWRILNCINRASRCSTTTYRSRCSARYPLR